MHRERKHRETYQSLLFGSEALSLEVNPALSLSFDEMRYAPNSYYEGPWKFKKHLFKLIGELKPQGEEHDCAVFIDQMPEADVWVRNLERRPEASFWLQTPTDRFYPDFVVRLNDGRILVIEYKGEYLWSNDDSKQKRMIGELWAERSNGQCLFVMPKGMDLGAIKSCIASQKP